ncbi:MAG: hypothetical protein JEY94_17575 [Melioribacteraceae bacterium]|nr:hypothetical protein [Melioribacteraceae bacterium]
MKKFIIIFITFIFVSCNLVSTRDPEIPSNNRSNFEVAATPEILFNNLRNSFSDKVVENYIACFVDVSFSDKEFIFEPAIEVASQFSNWNLDSEENYFKNIISIVDEESPIFLNLIETDSQLEGESADYFFDYEIIINSEDKRIVDSFKGSTHFKIYLDSRQHWVIANWRDYQSENNVSWSELKGRFY